MKPVEVAKLANVHPETARKWKRTVDKIQSKRYLPSKRRIAHQIELQVN